MDGYVLHGKFAVQVDTDEWARWFEKNRRTRCVRQSDVGAYRVSTMFLGLDHRFGDSGPPLIYETMVFGGPLDQHCWRDSTWWGAEARHDAICRIVKKFYLDVDVES